MKLRKQGFILIELMMYSGLLIFIVVIVMSYAAQSHLHINKQIGEASLYAHMSASLDRCMFDVSQSSSSKQLWKVATDKAHIWSTALGDIGWENTSKGLVRSQGYYDAQVSRWVTRTRSFFQATMLYQLDMIDETDTHIGAVKVTLKTDKGVMKVSRTIALCRGATV